MGSYYCNNNNYKNNYKYKYDYKNDYIISQSIYEGIIFMILGNLLNILIKNKYYIIGIILHILSENIGFHNYFINKYCIKK